MTLERYIPIGDPCKFCSERATRAFIHKDGKFGATVCCDQHTEECKLHVEDKKGGVFNMLTLRFASGEMGSKMPVSEGMQSVLTHHYHGRTYGSPDSGNARLAQEQYDLGNAVEQVVDGADPVDVIDELTEAYAYDAKAKAEADKILSLAYSHNRQGFEKAVADLKKSQHMGVMAALSAGYTSIMKTGAAMKPPSWAGEILKNHRII